MTGPKQFRIGGYVFTPSDSIPGRFVRGVLTPPVKHRVGAGLLLVAAVLMFSLTDLTSADIFFWLFFASVLFWNIDGRVPIGGALACLAAIPVLLVSERQFGFSRGEEWGEVVAVWAYFFLVMGVLKQIFELRRERDGDPEADAR